MPEPDLKAIATHVAAITQALNLTAAIAEDLRGALQPTVNQVTILFTEALIASVLYAEQHGCTRAEAMQLALATVAPAQSAVLAGINDAVNKRRNP